MTISPETRTFTKDGGGGAVIVTAGGAESWTATADVAWLNVTSGVAGTGAGQVVYLVSGNMTSDQRIGRITIGDKVCTIVQDGYASTIAPTSGSYGYQGGTGSIAVAVQAGITWTASTSTPWITILSGSPGTSSGSISYRINAYDGIPSRHGIITVAGKVFPVTQTGRSLILSPSSTRVDYQSHIVTFNVGALGTTSWQAQVDKPWVTVLSGSGSGDGVVTLAVGYNPSFATRSAPITVGGESYILEQTGVPEAQVAIDPSSVTAVAAGAFGLLNVSATPDAPWAATSDQGWVTLTSGTSGVGDGTIRYVVAANPVLESRTARITVTPYPQDPPANLLRDLAAWFVGQGGDWTGNGRQVNGGWTFDGLTQGASVPDVLNRPALPFTLTFWEAAAFLSRTNRLLEIKSSDGTQCGLFTGTDDVIRLQVNIPGSPPDLFVTGYKIPSTTAQHFMLIADEARRLRVFVNAELVADRVYETPPIPCDRDGLPNNGAIRWGNVDLPSPGYFQGGVSEVRVYHRALKDDELKQLEQQERTSTHASFYTGGSPAANIIARNCFARWDLEGNTLDGMRYGRTAQLRSASYTVDRFGRVRGALEVPVGHSALTIPDTETWGIPGRHITYSFWFKLRTVPSSRSVVAARGPVLVQVDGGHITMIHNGEVVLNFEKEMLPEAWYMITLVAISRPYHVWTPGPVLKYDNYRLTAFLDDVLLGSWERQGFDWCERDEPFSLGGGVDAVFDDLSVYEHLDDLHVAKLYAMTKPSQAVHTVVQEAINGTINPTNASFPAAGGSEATILTIATAARWGAQSDVGWIVLDSAASGSGTGTIAYTVSPNPTVYARSGSLTVAGQKLRVQQEGRMASVSQNVFGFGPAGDAGAFNLTTEAGASWQAVPSDPWIQIAQNSSGSGPSTIIFVTAPYASPFGSRTGTITIGSEVVTVTQMGYEAAVTPLVSEVVSSGGSCSVDVAVPIGAMWEAISRVPWITILGGQSRTGSGTLAYIVEANAGDVRSGTIYVAGEEVTITQRSAPLGDGDNDGLPDAWEIQHFGNTNSGADDDTDGDGFSNYMEWVHRTDPSSPTDTPDTTVSIYQAVEVNLQTVRGVQYHLQGSDDFKTWQPVGSTISGDGTVLQLFRRTGENPYRFYRVELGKP